MHHYFHMHFIRIASIVILTLAPVGATAVDMTFPRVFAQNDLLLNFIVRPDKDRQAECAAFAFAENNAIALSNFNKERYSPSDLDVESVYARWGISECIRVNKSGWIFSVGQGQYSEYQGNHDAGQLWIDLHSRDTSERDYNPVADGYRVQANWYSLGRAFSFARRDVTGTCEVHARFITTSDMLARNVVGNVEGDEYTGMMKTLRASAAKDGVSGRGWALDCRVLGAFKDKMRFLASVEGLLGRVSWSQAVVEDDYISSPSVFEDPDGFLRDYFAMSGIGWRQDKGVDINRLVRLETVITNTTPYKIMGLTWEEGHTTLLAFGATWPQRRNWLPYACYYPSENRLEIGSYAQMWHICASADILNGGPLMKAALAVGIDLTF